MKILADLHIHSKYAMATSPRSDLNSFSEWAKFKGIDLLGTGDFCHPLWFKELKEKLKETEKGIYEYKGINYILQNEVSTIYYKNGKCKKIHHILYAPSLEIVEQISDVLGKKCDLKSDGRPIFKISSPELVETIMNISRDNEVVSAHCFTPWFGVFGSRGGFDSLEDCYEDQTKHIHALETGLSADPPMFWRISNLDKYNLISNSDCHSPEKLGRELNELELEKLSYKNILQALRTKNEKNKITKTYEFYPEEGKYHVDGHRTCNVVLTPQESKKYNNICPVCRKQLTLGVLHRVDDLADREIGKKPLTAILFQHLVPLRQIIAKVLNKGENTKTVEEEYFKYITYFGNEFKVLTASKESLNLAGKSEISEAIWRAQNENLTVIPGYDGVFGKIEFKEDLKKEKLKRPKQDSLLNY